MLITSGLSGMRTINRTYSVMLVSVNSRTGTDMEIHLLLLRAERRASWFVSSAAYVSSGISDYGSGSYRYTTYRSTLDFRVLLLVQVPPRLAIEHRRIRSGQRQQSMPQSDPGTALFSLHHTAQPLFVGSLDCRPFKHPAQGLPGRLCKGVCLLVSAHTHSAFRSRLGETSPAARLNRVDNPRSKVFFTSGGYLLATASLQRLCGHRMLPGVRALPPGLAGLSRWLERDGEGDGHSNVASRCSRLALGFPLLFGWACCPGVVEGVADVVARRLPAHPAQFLLGLGAHHSVSFEEYRQLVRAAVLAGNWGTSCRHCSGRAPPPSLWDRLRERHARCLRVLPAPPASP